IKHPRVRLRDRSALAEAARGMDGDVRVLRDPERLEPLVLDDTRQLGDADRALSGEEVDADVHRSCSWRPVIAAGAVEIIRQFYRFSRPGAIMTRTAGSARLGEYALRQWNPANL